MLANMMLAERHLEKQKSIPRFQPTLAKRYDGEDILREELQSLPRTLTYEILEIQRYPKCKKKFTEYSVLSHKDNKTEVCPECEIKEALEVFSYRN